ncbi:MAG: hypothetical protein M3R02_29090 [Chloroflexota bacterium]|nr:hypothetical protein [Chloroflexota bacterium]
MPSKSNANRSALTIVQLNAIDCLAVGKTDGETAEAVGVTRQTINGWRNHHPEFIATLNARRLEIWRAAQDRLPAILPHAFNTLEAAVTGDSPDWRAAVRIIQLSGLTSQRQNRSTGGPAHIGPTEPLAVVDAEVRRRRADDLLRMVGGAVTEEERQAVLDEWRSCSSE